MKPDPTWPHGPQPAGQVTLQLHGCPGLFLRVRGHNAPICLGCARYGVQTPDMLQPAAAFEGGEWQCIERRSLGMAPVAPVPAPGVCSVHGSDCLTPSNAGEPCGLGGSPIGGNAAGGVMA